MKSRSVADSVIATFAMLAEVEMVMGRVCRIETRAKNCGEITAG